MSDGGGGDGDGGDGDGGGAAAGAAAAAAGDATSDAMSSPNTASDHRTDGRFVSALGLSPSMLRPPSRRFAG